MLYSQKPNGFNPVCDVVGVFVEVKEVETKILVLHRHPDKPEPSTWSVPGGKVDKDEGLEQAAARELFEETGIVVPQASLNFIDTYYVCYADYHFVYSTFYVQLDARQDVTLSPTEHVAHEWVTPDVAMFMRLIEDEDECIKRRYFPQLASNA